jgi:hypothetical protein
LRYVYENYVFVNDNNKGILYKDNTLVFMGNAWTGINIFLNSTNHAQEVRDMFKSQLDQREQIRFKAESKKPKDPDPVQRPEPKKEPVLRRSRNDRRLVR